MDMLRVFVERSHDCINYGPNIKCMHTKNKKIQQSLNAGKSSKLGLPVAVYVYVSIRIYEYISMYMYLCIYV
jgi:hypothetical protein